MSVTIIQQRLEAYGCQTTAEEDHALREITQDLVLAALTRTDFFSHAAFQGGTCLRIFHRLPRFSEDLDFALAEPNLAFELAPYLKACREELAAYGYDVEIDDRTKLGRAVKHAFLKDDSIGRLLRLSYQSANGAMRKIRVKMELDANPPTGANYDLSYLDFPFPGSVRCFDLASLFAGKLHALLCRAYVKGRDWYDFNWYQSQRVPVNLKLLSAALDQTGPWQGQGIDVDHEWLRTTLADRVEEIDWEAAKRDVQRFLNQHDRQRIAIWSADYFHAQRLKIQ